MQTLFVTAASPDAIAIALGIAFAPLAIVSTILAYLGRPAVAALGTSERFS